MAKDSTDIYIKNGGETVRISVDGEQLEGRLSGTVTGVETVAREVSARQDAVNEWRRVKAVVDACPSQGHRTQAMPYLSLALRPLRLAGLMEESGDNYARAFESARSLIAQAEKRITG